jgi:hypothetical protein
MYYSSVDNFGEFSDRLVKQFVFCYSIAIATCTHTCEFYSRIAMRIYYFIHIRPGLLYIPHMLSMSVCVAFQRSNPWDPSSKGLSPFVDKPCVVCVCSSYITNSI